MGWLKTTRYKLLIVGALIVVLFAGNLMSDQRAYRQAGTEPVEMTLAQAREVAASKGFVTRWVRLSEPLDLNCLQAMGWKEEDNTTMIVPAFDKAKQQPFWLEYQGWHNCEGLRAMPLEGMLVSPDKFWTKQGMVIPLATYPLMELKVGATPADLRKKINTWLGVEFFGVVMLAIGLLLKPKNVGTVLTHPLLNRS